MLIMQIQFHYIQIIILINSQLIHNSFIILFQQTIIFRFHIIISNFKI